MGSAEGNGQKTAQKWGNSFKNDLIDAIRETKAHQFFKFTKELNVGVAAVRRAVTDLSVTTVRLAAASPPMADSED